jgi:hypothetical protein
MLQTLEIVPDHTGTNELIRKRAQWLFHWSRDYLSFEDSSDFAIGEIYRYAYLILRGPKLFLESFMQGRVDLDQDILDESFWSLRHEIPGPQGMLPSERLLINEHNNEVKTLKSPLRVVGEL